MKNQVDGGKAIPLGKGTSAINLPIRGKIITNLLVGIIVALLAVGGFLWTDYTGQLKEQELLKGQIADARQALAQIPALPQGLELRLAEAEATLAAEQNAFPVKMNSTELISSILKLADESGVKAVPLSTEPWSTQEVGQHDYQVFRLRVAALGSFSQLVSLVSKLENGEFGTLIVEKLAVSVVGQPEESNTEEIIPVMASLDLAIYARPLSFD